MAGNPFAFKCFYTLAGLIIPLSSIGLTQREGLKFLHVNSGLKANPGWYFQSNNLVVSSVFFVHQDLPPSHCTFQVFVCHLSSPYVFSFPLVERPAQVRLEPNHTLLQTDNLGWCKVCIFSTLYSDSTQAKSNQGSCKEGLTRLLLRLSFRAHSTKPPNLSKVTCTCSRKSDVGFFPALPANT